MEIPKTCPKINDSSGIGCGVSFAGLENLYQDTDGIRLLLKLRD